MTAIPGYTVLRQLGQGGMAEVFLVVQESLGREVALKVLSSASARDDSSRERFLREARIAASLHHPHIVPIHDFGVHEGCAYIAMEYEPGGTIAPGAGERLEPQAALRLVRDIAGALDYAHGRGVVHRDIKPENVLRRADGAAILSDFGIARLIQGESVLTTEGTSVGTPHYMSPEQLRGEKVDGRSDLYSLGILLWQLLTGELPYKGSDSWAIGSQHLNAGIPRLPPAMAHLQGLVDALLAKAADARLQSGAEVVRRIDALLAVSANQATMLETPSQLGQRRAAWSRRNVGAAALLVAGVLVVALLGWRRFAAGPAIVPAPPALAPTPAAATVAKSIAVLAFEDLSEAHDQGYFSDGISEELSNRLAQVPGLRVAGRSSSQSFKGKEATIAQIGRALDVSQVLEGSVRKDGDRLRVSVQLSNVADGYQLWSQSYDRKLTDVFAVQDDISSAVVEALKLALLPGPHPATNKRHTPSFEVYDHYLRGRQAMAGSGENSVERALESFRKAVALDPDYAEAFAGLAMAESFMAEGDPDPIHRDQGFQRASTAAERAVALDPGLGDAYSTRGYVRAIDFWDWNGAMADSEKAIAIDPGDARNQLRHCYLLAALGRLPEGAKACDLGTRQDPLFAPVWYQLGRLRAAQGDYPGAISAMNRTLAIDPGFRPAAQYLGTIALLQGDAGKAKTVFAQVDSPIGLALAEHALGDGVESRRLLAEIIAKHANDFAYGIATVHAWSGDREQAFAWLDRAVAQHEIGVILLKSDPLLHGLRGDPRYLALLKKLKLPVL